MNHPIKCKLQLQLSKTHSNRGATLMLVLIATIVGFSAATGILFDSQTVVRSFYNEDARVRATHLSEDGIRIARFLIESEAGWIDEMDGGFFIDAVQPDSSRIQVSGRVIRLGSDVWIDIPVIDNGFELASSQLPNPLFGPPMSGSYGAWEATRFGLVETGPTVPNIGISSIGTVTEGSSGGFIRFLLSVTGWGMFSQTLSETLEPNSRYRLSVDVGTGSLATILAETSVSVYAGGELLAESDDADCLTILDLGNGYSTYQVEFETSNTPVTDALRIELRSSSLVGVLSATVFDHIRFERQPIAADLIELESIGVYRSQQLVIRPKILVNTGISETTTRIVDWIEE